MVHAVKRVKKKEELPEHAIAQGRPKSGGSKVTDISLVKTLLSECDAKHHLLIVYV